MLTYLTCREEDGWNVRLAQTQTDAMEAAAQEICEAVGANSDFPFHCGGEEYTVFYDDEIFTKGKKYVVASLYLQGDADKSYRHPEGPDLVFGNFAIVKGHTHEGVLKGLDKDDVVRISNFIVDSDKALREMRKKKLFSQGEVIRPLLIKRER